MTSYELPLKAIQRLPTEAVKQLFKNFEHAFLCVHKCMCVEWNGFQCGEIRYKHTQVTDIPFSVF